MANMILGSQNIMPTDIPQVNMTDAQARTLEDISVSTERDAAKLQQTSEKLYLSSFELSAREAINEITERNKSDPENLKKDLIESYKGFSQNAPSHLRGVMEANYEIMGRPAINNAIKLRTKINDDSLKETSLKNITESFKNLEQNAAGMLSDDSHVAFDASRSAQLQMKTIEDMANALSEDGTPLFSAEKRVSFLEKAKQSLVESGVKGWFDQQPNKVKAYKDLIEGKKTFKLYNQNNELDVEIDPLFEMNRGTFESVRNYMESDIKRGLKASSDAAENANFQSMMQSESILIDPNDKGQRKKIDQYFNQVVTPKLAALNPEERNDEIASFVKRVGIIPAEVKGVLRSTLRNGSVDNQVMSAGLISRLQEEAPQSLAEVNGSDVSYGLMVSKKLRGGLTPEEAVIQTKESFDPLKQDLRQRRAEDFKNIKIDSEAELKDQFAKREWSTLFTNTTELTNVKGASDQAKIDYINAYKDQYILTGDQETAQKRAKDIIQRQYGVTTISGSPRVMKYAPENYYSVKGLDNGWMEKQLVNDVKEQIGKDIQKEDIALVADAQTAREVDTNQSPSYTVMMRNESGSYEPLHKNRRLMRYSFDSDAAVREHNRIIDEENNKSLADSVQSFKTLRKMEIDRINRVMSGEIVGAKF